MIDKLGFAFHEGCKVIRAVMSGKSPMLDICVVTKIDGNKLYLDGSKQPVWYPDRLIIWEQDQLYRMVKNHKATK